MKKGCGLCKRYGHECQHHPDRPKEKPKAKPKLTAKQARFVDEYLIDSNATQAAIRAGYSEKTANRAGSRLLSNVVISELLAERQKAIETKLEITANDIASELYKLGFSNMADYMRVTSDGDPYLDLSALTRDQAAAISEVTIDDYVEGRGEDARSVRKVKAKLADKRAALVDLAKLLGYYGERIIIEAVDRLRDQERAGFFAALDELGKVEGELTAQQFIELLVAKLQGDGQEDGRVHY